MFPLMVNADDFKLTCDQNKLNINDEFTCRVAVNTSANFNQITFKLNLPDGISLVDTRSNYEQLWEIKNANNIITSATKNKEIETGLQEFAILLLKATTSGNKIINLSDIKITNLNDNSDKIFDNVESSLKVISVNNNVKEVKINDQVYSDFNNRNDSFKITTMETKLKIDVVAEDEFAKVYNNNTYDFDAKNNELIIPISIESESGNYKIFYFDFIHNNIAVNDIDKSLESIIIKDNNGNNILFNYNPKIKNYNIDVDPSTASVTINPSLNNKDTSFVDGYAKQTINLNSGNNIVLIKIIDNEGQTNTYILNITKPLSNLSNNGYLKDLLIKGYKLNFNKKVKNYTLKINHHTDKLDINPLVEDENASFVIEGNNNLKKGSIVKIVVTAPNESKTVYQINIDYKAFNYGLLLFILIVLGLIAYVIKNNYHKFKNHQKIKVIKKEPFVKKQNKKAIKQTSSKNVKKVEKFQIKKSPTKKRKTTKKKKKKTNYKKK